MSQRELFDLNAEKAVLGAMLLAPDVIGEVEGIISARSFYRTQHATLFSLITELHAAGKPTDVVAVNAELTERGLIGRLGGFAYLHDLVEAVPVPAMAGHYARTVAEMALLRELDARSRRVQQMVAQGGAEAVELLDQAQQLFAEVRPDGAYEDESALWGDIAPAVLEAAERAAAHDREIPGLPTGLVDLDHLLNGLHPGQLIVVAGRPGMGKSVCVLGMAQHVAWRHKQPVLVFSLEMTRLELGQRLLAAGASVPLTAIQTGKLDDAQWSRITQLAGETGDAPLRIDDTPSLSLADIRARARRVHRREGGLALVVVDYLQLVNAPAAESRQVAVSAVSRGLKMLAKELGCPVVVAAQLNRQPEQRHDRKPRLSDLRESGSIEADCDVAILIHREDYYDPDSTRVGEADLIVEKNRGGPTDTVTVAAQLHFARFASMARTPR